jgi:hypothetical protein
MIHGKIASALYAWRDFAQEALRLNALLAGASSRWMLRDLAVGFITWRCNYEEICEQQILLLQALHSFLNQQLAAGFRTWLSSVRQLHHTQHVASIAIARWQNSQLVWALSMWRYGCVLDKEQETMYQWVLRHCRLRELDWSLRLWRHLTARQTRVQYALVRWSNQAAVRALNSWREFASDRRKALMLAAQSRAKVLFYLKNRLVVMAWNSWVTAHVQIKREQCLIYKCVGRMIHRQLGCALVTWRENTSSSSDSQTTLFWALSHWTLQAAGRALNQWRSVAEELHEQQLLMQQGLRLFNKAMTAACFTWRTAAAAMREQQELMQRALGKLINGKLSAGFSTWLECLRAVKEQQQTMRGVLMRMVYRKLTLALNMWREQVQNALDAVANAKRAMLRFLNQALIQSFQSWYDWYDNMITQQAALHKSLARLMNRQLTAGFNSWYAHAVQLAIQSQAATKAVRYMQMQKQAEAWNTWRESYESGFDDQSNLLRALFCLTHQQLMAAFNSWFNFAAQMQAEKQLLAWAVANFLHLQMACAFHKWLEWARECNDQKALIARALYLREISVHSHLMSCAGCMLDTWRYSASVCSVRQALLVKAVLTWQNTELAGALGKWRMQTVMARSMILLYKWVSYHWVLREKRWAFRVLRHLKNQYSLGAKAAKRWAMRLLYSAFNTWRMVVAHELRQLRKNENDMGRTHWEEMALLVNFTKWHDRSLQVTALYAQVYRGACHWSRKQAIISTTRWTEWQRTVVWMEGQAFRGACLWSQSRAVQAMKRWQELTSRQQESMESLYKAMFRWAHGKLSACFVTWHTRAQQGRQHEMMVIAAQHFRYASIFVVLDHWRDVVNQLAQVEHHHVQNNYKAASHRRYTALRAAFEGWKDEWMDNQGVDEQIVDQSGPRNVLAQACHPYGMFAVSITGTMYGKQDRALYYIVQVSFEGRQLYELNKRYRDFDELNSTLKERFSTIMRPGSANAPMFPPKKPFTKLNPEFYESRAADLHQFMQGCVSHREVAASGEMCEFLEFQNYYY